MIIPAILYTFKGKILLGIAALGSTIAISEVVMGQLIASIPPTLAVIVSLFVLTKKQDKIAHAVDGKLNDLMDAKIAAGKAAGKEEERVEERGRKGEAAIAAQEAEPTPVIVENTKDNPAHVKPVE